MKNSVHPAMCKTFISSAILLILLSGCSLFSPMVSTVWTNVPEVAAYAEIYNGIGDEVRINVVYKEYPTRISPDQLPPDMIIGTNLNSIKNIPLFMSLENLFDEESGMRESDFYSGVLSLGVHEGAKVLLPISFNIEGLMFKKGDKAIPSTLISLEEMRKLAAEHNESSQPQYQTMGFSPAWTSDAGVMISRLMNVDFRENAIGTLVWNEEALAESIDFARSWIVDTNGGFAKDQEFIQKYLYDPGHKLLNTSPPRIRFFPTTLNHFARLPSQDRDPLDIVWLHHEEKIEVMENIVFAGILKQSRSKKRSKEFLVWLASEQTQKMLLESERFKRIRTFGIANGLSTLISINENTFPRFYSFLVGRIPPAKYIHFPSALPGEWQQLSAEVIHPWIEAQLNMENPPNDSLPEQIRKWYLQQPNY